MTLIADLTEKEQNRLWSKIIIDTETGCWIWTGAKVKNRGYGAFNFRGRTEMVHRLMYAWLVAPLPTGKGNGIPVLDHVVCNNRACCNPDHVKLGPQRNNMMRCDCPPAVNARKTHCIRGHPLPEPNERKSDGTTHRCCVICRRMRARRYYFARKKAAQDKSTTFS